LKEGRETIAALLILSTFAHFSISILGYNRAPFNTLRFCVV